MPLLSFSVTTSLVSDIDQTDPGKSAILMLCCYVCHVYCVVIFLRGRIFSFTILSTSEEKDKY